MRGRPDGRDQIDEDVAGSIAQTGRRVRKNTHGHRRSPVGTGPTAGTAGTAGTAVGAGRSTCRMRRGLAGAPPGGIWLVRGATSRRGECQVRLPTTDPGADWKRSAGRGLPPQSIMSPNGSQTMEMRRPPRVRPARSEPGRSMGRIPHPDLVKSKPPPLMRKEHGGRTHPNLI